MAQAKKDKTEKKELEAALEELIADAQRLTADVSEQIEQILQQGIDRPLSKGEARRLFTQVASVVRQHAEKIGDRKTAAAMADGKFVEKVLAARGHLGGIGDNGGAAETRRSHTRNAAKLVAHNGIKPRAVFPRPTFHGREIPMNSGFVKTKDIRLWEANERLDVHVNQFREQNKGRTPTADEVLDIMLTNLGLPGVTKVDEFKIQDLAASIANNGVRRPPVIDLDGTLRDGNRRVSACNLILNSDSFTAEQKKRAEWIFVWQFTEHATDEDRELVMVSLNFEPDHKQDWPTYVKARKVWDEWQRHLALEPRAPGRPRQLEIQHEITRDFALGPGLTNVQRYIRMVDWANEFEEHQVKERKHDEYEVKHRARQKFEYFDELSKGANPGGVAHTLGQDEKLKELAFDLLFKDRFKNFGQVRLLKYVPDNTDVLEALRKARDEKDPDSAREKVEDALDILKSTRAEKRRLGANAKIEAFVEWIEQVPLATPRDQVKPENVEALLRALKLVKQQAVGILGEKRVDDLLRD